MPTCPKAGCDEGRVASNFPKTQMEEHSLRRASITNNMHEQKRKEKGGVIGHSYRKLLIVWF
jgi:hypothetical protein